MKKKLLLVLAITLIFSCKNDKIAKKRRLLQDSLSNVKSFGNKIESKDAIAINALLKDYRALKIGDSISTKIVGKVNAVCKAKGCWMKLAMEDEEIMVKFKDYGFFVPRDIEDKEVVINGKAYVKEVSIEEQRHYAKDAGQSEEELAAINTPKRTYLFEADGVLLN